MKKKSTHYVNNKDFLHAIIDYKEALQKNPNHIMSRYIGECLILIASKLANKINFANYSYRDEMIQDGIENCLMYFTNFDPAKSSNPFAYFTQIIHFSFIRRIQKEKKQQYVKLKNVQNYFMECDLSAEAGSSDKELYNNNNDFILQYEKHLSEKKKKNKIAGIEKFLEEEEVSDVVG